MSNMNEKLEKFDSRGVQTMFRTVSRNHYNLLKMVDNKASIILTVNSIIISLMMGVIYFVQNDTGDVIRLGSKILLNFGMASMVFALLAMLPHRYSKKRGNGDLYKGLLYAGSYRKLSEEEYLESIKTVMSKGTYVYNEMIIDLFHLGKAVSIKQRLIWVSVLIFLTGLVLTILHTLSHGVNIEDILLN